MDRKGLRILVVDDLPAMRRLIRGMLKGLGYSAVDEAGDGLDALKRLKSARYDIVISDWNMPVMDGREFLRSVRDDASFEALVFVVVTAEKGNLDDILACGADACLPKPFDAAMLSEAIAEAVEKRARRGR